MEGDRKQEWGTWLRPSASPAVGSVDPLHPKGLISPGTAPGAGPPGFPMGIALAKHQPQKICSKLKLSPCES